eukprot:9488942-Pyramimonas_sp.AAC.2
MRRTFTQNAVSPDGATLVTGSFDRTARVQSTSDSSFPRTLAVFSEGAQAGPVASAPHARCAVVKPGDEGPSVWRDRILRKGAPRRVRVLYVLYPSRRGRAASPDRTTPPTTTTSRFLFLASAAEGLKLLVAGHETAAEEMASLEAQLEAVLREDVAPVQTDKSAKERAAEVARGNAEKALAAHKVTRATPTNTTRGRLRGPFSDRGGPFSKPLRQRGG